MKIIKRKPRQGHGCWLEIEVELQGIDHPISDLKRWLGSLKSMLVTLYSPSGASKGQRHLIELSSAFGTGLLFSLMKAVESREARLRNEGREPDDVGIDIVDDSFRTVGTRDIVNCWIDSPIFDLVVSGRQSILQDYHWVSDNPSEYFFIYGNRDAFLAELLPTLYRRAENRRNRMYWKFYHTPKRNRYEDLSLLESHYFDTALENRYFESFDNSLLQGFADEIARITDSSPKLDELGEQMVSIATRMLGASQEIGVE